MNRFPAYKPPAQGAPARAGGAAVRNTALDGLPQQPRRGHHPHAYIPPNPGDDGTDAQALLEAAQAELQRQTRQLEARSAEIDAVALRYAAGIVSLAQAADTAERVLAHDAIAVGVLVAEQLLEHAFARDARAIADVVRGALREVPDEAGTRVRVCPDDLPRVELVMAGTKRAAVELVADASLGPGDCVVESPSLVVDARLRERLTAIKDALLQSVSAEAWLPTHDEVSMDERGVSLDQVPTPDEAPSDADSISMDDAGPDAITLDGPDAELPPC